VIWTITQDTPPWPSSTTSEYNSPIAEIVRATQWHIGQLAGAAGMKIIQHIIDDDAAQLAGEQRYTRNGKEGQLSGRQSGW